MSWVVKWWLTPPLTAAVSAPPVLAGSLTRGIPLAAMMAGQQHALLGLHRLRLVGIVVVQAEQVQKAVDDQQGQSRRRRCRRARARLRWATAGQITTSPRRVGASSGSTLKPGPVPPESGERPLSAGSSSMGNASTSVGPSLPRNREFRSAMAVSSTNSIDTSVSPRTPSSARTASASLIQRKRVDRIGRLLICCEYDRAHG